ncbi:MAG: DNA-3-methyladenine glycosylase [Bacteroidia bacterium]|nr:DNA-3-methyladenine glycosylase [Bacteroidia bacterium]MDW8158105.1 DNA-3-methyladenine glycosylase [Bacteroidia bacterium]
MQGGYLSQDFFIRPDVTTIARELLGQFLFVRCSNGNIVGGIIVETEAYNGIYDKACHAYGNRKTQRTAVMYQKGGCLYVYLCYGLHYLLNIITNEAGKADAVLIRAIEPRVGISTMLANRKMKTLGPELTSGPGKLTQALGINLRHNGLYLSPNQVWLEQGICPKEIVADTRIGVSYAQEHALLPWRFYIANNPWVSKPKFY